MLNDRIEISTPERVTVAYELAGVGSRMLAQAIDILIVSAIVIGIVLAASLLRSTVTLAIAIGAITLTPVGYFLLLEWLRRGSTPGKAALRLRVVAASGEPIGLQAAAVRNLLRIVDFLPFAYILGGICAMVSADGRRFGDMAAGTVVIRLDDEHSAAFEGTFAAAAAAAQSDAIPPELMAIAVAFRRRAREIAPDARTALAVRIAGRIEPYWARPEGMEPEEYVHRAATRTLPGGPTR
ncbi:MAG TPA: RDD family protein [Gaiellales bacterium]